MRDRRSFWQKQLSRRRMLKGLGRAGMGVMGLAAVGCAAAPAATPTRAPAAPGAATPTSRPAASPTPVAKQLDRLVLGHNRDIVTLDPGLTSSTIPAMGALQMMYDGLTVHDRKSQAVPSLATSWENPDQLTWLFKLRPGVKFHNGYDFEAADVKFTIERMIDPQTKSPLVTLVRNVDKVEAVDQGAVKIVTKVVEPAFLRMIPDVFIISQKYLKESDPAIMQNKPVGTGPYRFVKWTKDDALELTALENHFRIGKPPSRTFFQRVIPSDTPRMAALTTGEIEYAFGVPPEQWEQIEKDPNLGLLVDDWNLSFPHLGISQFGESPLRDKRVRLAINYAINREEMAKGLFKGKVRPVGQPLSPACFGYDEAIKSYPYDPQKAKALLAEAGYPNGLEITFWITPEASYLMQKEYNEATMGFLNAVGIKTNVKTVPVGQSSQFFERMRGRNEGPEGIFHMAGMCGVFLDAFQLLESHYVTFNEQTGLGNKMYWSDSEIDAWAKEARNILDEKKRKELYSKIFRKMNEEALTIPLFSMVYAWGYNKKKVKAIYPRQSRHAAWDIEVA
ncbi:MAG: hypothetical protein HYU86_01655 [Chloroflexi bacterium]|nr:hypothetical protein [Chloroflexota bacterium]